MSIVKKSRAAKLVEAILKEAPTKNQVPASPGMLFVSSGEDGMGAGELFVDKNLTDSDEIEDLTLTRYTIAELNEVLAELGYKVVKA
jgi:hypothetical protein